MLQNKGVAANAVMKNSMAQYQGLPFVKHLAGTIAKGKGVLSNATIKTLETLAQTDCPALSNSPTYTSIPLDPKGFTNTIGNLASTYLGGGDLSKFTQAYDQAALFIGQTNDYINAVNTGATDVSGTFTNINDLITGGVSQVCTNPSALGKDLANLGYLINLEDLENWGTPMALVRSVIGRTKVVPPPMQIAFTVLGIDPDIVENLVDPETEVDDHTQQIMFAAFSAMRNDSLKQIMKVLKIKNLNGINTVADLLNPVKILPLSYQTLRVPSNAGFIPVYNGNNINPVVKGSLPFYGQRASDTGYDMTAIDVMGAMTLPEYACGNKALTFILAQINGVIFMDLPTLADMLLNINTTDQPLIVNLTSPLTPDLINYFKTLYPMGTGPNSTVVICDLFGTLAGYHIRDPLQHTMSNIANVNVERYNTICEAMETVVMGNKGIKFVQVPSGLTANATYPTREAAVKALIVSAQGEIANITATFPKETANLNNAWRTMSDQYNREITMVGAANIHFDSMRKNDRQTVMSWCNRFYDFGQDMTPGGHHEFLESVADKSNRPGQAIIAGMTHGLNETSLSKAGVFTNTGIMLKK